MTNDGATILSLLDIEHPAAKILVDLAQQQDKEVRVTRRPMYLSSFSTETLPGWRWHYICRPHRFRTPATSQRAYEEPHTPHHHH